MYVDLYYTDYTSGIHTLLVSVLWFISHGWWTVLIWKGTLMDLLFLVFPWFEFAIKLPGVKPFFAYPEPFLGVILAELQPYLGLKGSGSAWVLVWRGVDLQAARVIYCIYIYINLEPQWPLFLKVKPPKQGLFQPKRGSFGFQVHDL